MQVAPVPQSSLQKNEPGVGLSICLISILLALFLGTIATGLTTDPSRYWLGNVVVGLYLIAWGCMFLAAYYYSHKTFFLRALIWICEHFSRPAHRKMAFFCFALFAGMGFVLLVQGLRRA